MPRLPFSNVLGNDLYFHAQCSCPSKMFLGTPVEHIMKTKLTLTGYNDANFFDNVNAEPRELACGCGRRFKAQWFRNGVDFEWLSPASPDLDTEVEDLISSVGQP